MQHELSCFCVVGGTLIPRPFELKSRIDWFVGFTIRPFLRTTCVNRGSGVDVEAFFSGVLFLFCYFVCHVGVDGRLDEVMAEAAASRATIKA